MGVNAELILPRRLNWKADVAKLSPFNRKLMWVQAASPAFGALTFLLHNEMLRESRPRATFIGACCTARIVVDFTY